MKEINIVPKLKNDYIVMNNELKHNIMSYILLFGTECLEILLNDVFKDLHVDKVKLKANNCIVVEKGLKCI